MTVSELISLLSDIESEGFGDSELRMLYQPSWTLQFDVQGISVSTDFEDEEDGYDYDEPDHDTRGQEPDLEDEEPVVYIVQGDHPSNDSPYGPNAAWDAVRYG